MPLPNRPTRRIATGYMGRFLIPPGTAPGHIAPRERASSHARATYCVPSFRGLLHQTSRSWGDRVAAKTPADRRDQARHRTTAVGSGKAGAMDSTAIIAQLVEGLDPGALITGFVVVAEIIDSDGDRGLWVDTHDGASRWDTYGLLTWALNEENACHHAAVVLAYGDDDEDTV